MKTGLLYICLIFAGLGTVFPVHCADNVVLRMSWWGGKARQQQTNAALEAFEKRYPSITVKAENTGWDGHLARMSAQMSGALNRTSCRPTGRGCRSFPATGTVITTSMR